MDPNVSLTSVTGMEQKNELVPSAHRSRRVWMRCSECLNGTAGSSSGPFCGLKVASIQFLRVPIPQFGSLIFFFGLALSFLDTVPLQTPYELIDQTCISLQTFVLRLCFSHKETYIFLQTL